MTPKILLAALVAGLCTPALAEITVTDPYARVSTPMSKSGAAFMVIENSGDTEDRLIDVRSDVADRVELHTHLESAEGVMQMRHVPEGFALPAHARHALARGGDHVMFLGLTRSLRHGDSVPLTLVFEKAGEITLDVPVDLKRADPERAGDASGTPTPMHGSHDMGAPAGHAHGAAHQTGASH